MAHRLFRIRILPHILLPGKVEGVPAELHQKALVLCECMGGVDGNLLRNPSDLEAVETIQPKTTAVASFWVSTFLVMSYVRRA